MDVIVTGGAGYIGNVICHELRDAGLRPLIVDNLSTGHECRLEGFDHIVGSIGESSTTDKIKAKLAPPYTVVHCAASIVVPESVTKPLGYLRNNIAETLQFLDALTSDGGAKVILSSTGSMYANREALFCVDEDAEIDPVNPYSLSKHLLEVMLSEAARLGKIDFMSLRYFNPIGCDRLFRSGPLDPNPTHILGSLLKAHIQEKEFVIAGEDWETRDGTALRDYIDVADLAQAHVSAIEYMQQQSSIETMPNKDGIPVVNLGTGTGTTVKEFITAFETACGSKLNSVVGERREGDTRGTYCNSDKALGLLGWRTQTDISRSIKNSLEWMRR